MFPQSEIIKILGHLKRKYKDAFYSLAPIPFVVFSLDIHSSFSFGVQALA